MLPTPLPAARPRDLQATAVKHSVPWRAAVRLDTLPPRKQQHRLLNGEDGASVPAMRRLSLNSAALQRGSGRDMNGPAELSQYSQCHS